MKKIIGFVFTVLLSFGLIACGDNSMTATAQITGLEPDTTTVTFNIELTDPDDLLTSTITVRVFRQDGSLFTESVVSDLTPAALEGLNVTNLTQGTTYTIEVFAPGERKLFSIGKTTFTTLSTATIEITTTEQFLNMSANRSGNYLLMNDLDFTGVTFNSPFTSAFSGTFDGQGYTISNVTFEKVSTYTGVFGYVSSGKISNLNFDNINIGTVEAPLPMATSSRVGIVAGYVSSATAKIENITVTNSQIAFSTASTVQAYVGGFVGELRATLIDSMIDSTVIDMKSTSYGRIRIGGAIGFLTEDGILKQVGSDVDIHFEMNGTNIKDRDIQINIGGLIGNHNATSNTNAVQNVFAKGDIEATLNFGTATGTTKGNYSISIGGLAGLANANITEAFYQGSIEVTHSANDHEENVNKYFNLGGLIGSYVSNRALNKVVRLGDDQTLAFNIGTDYHTLRVSQTLGQNASSATHNLGIYGDTNLSLNNVSIVGDDTSPVINDLDGYFTNEFILNQFA